MGVGPGFPIPVVNAVSSRIAQQPNSVTLRQSLMLCRCALESLCQYFPFCEFKQVSSWASIFSSRKGVDNGFMVMCAESLAQKKWSTGDYYHYYYWAYFPTYYNICLFLFFFFYTNMSCMRAHMFIWLVTGGSSVPRAVSDTIKTCWMNELSEWADGLHRSCRIPFVCTTGRLTADLLGRAWIVASSVCP